MFSRININKIIIAHYKSLSNLNDRKIAINDLIIFILFPFLIAIVLIYYNISIKSQVANLITALSILAGFLFNLLAIIHSSLGKIRDEIRQQNLEENSLKYKFANEIHANISYNILIAILTIVTLVVSGLNIEFNNKALKYISFCFLNSICYFLLIHFLLTLVMILNRVYILLDKE
ncbi:MULTISPECIES: hypothetical protein [unclassified Chryseobacterium]|uniref:hypothetical protein n=1 Tax=unclassified Chryseobacterium TaxID=2593645 RepID=UPI001C5B7583|nr:MULTISPECIES: hypothetical protein [unclassified Chryseobacterium]MBW3521347.1 hypothetical protein [Chryseobacterium sp. NKUCC03_KSP]MCD0457001.1 hypothetical protein [Chryseobacterium sp. LC2016-27]